jgi:hypothetical protein
MQKARHLGFVAPGAGQAWRGRRALLLMAVISGLFAVAASLGWNSGFPSGGDTPSRHAAAREPANVALGPPPNLIRLVPPEAALKLNASRPFSTRVDRPAVSFRIGQVKQVDLSRAIQCLAQAIYYEAGGEGADGERAVAQVVLNRVRHPGYPPSICGVVYQGAERTTGCQFTFTCDGSLLRIPLGPLWTRAQRLARKALVSGYVFGPVGHATHYHADYVIPYWAESLEKETQIGRHIFYRLPGILGAAAAFGQQYSHLEPLPPSTSAATVAAEAVQAAIDDQAANDPLGAIVGSRPAESRLPPAVPLIADETTGSLIAPYASHVIASPGLKAVDCASATESKQIKPAAANDLRSNSRSTLC